MKKKIAALLFTGIICLISVGLQGQFNNSPDAGVSGVTIVKGQVYDTDPDKAWDLVTFGVAGKEKVLYEVTYVDIIDEDGKFIVRVSNLQSMGFEGDASWYFIDLNSFKIRRDFTLEVHVIPAGRIFVNKISAQANNGNNGNAPIDPEETILIVKYP